MGVSQYLEMMRAGHLQKFPKSVKRREHIPLASLFLLTHQFPRTTVRGRGCLPEVSPPSSSYPSLLPSHSSASPLLRFRVFLLALLIRVPTLPEGSLEHPQYATLLSTSHDFLFALSLHQAPWEVPCSAVASPAGCFSLPCSLLCEVPSQPLSYMQKSRSLSIDSVQGPLGTGGTGSETEN